MPTTRRTFLQSAAVARAAASAASPAPDAPLDPVAIARRHPIVRTGPTPDFFEGMLLGNGDIGVCITVRPDALGLHIGKNDSWDIRVSEEHAADILPFSDVLKMWERAAAEARRQGKPEMIYLEENIDFFREYTQKVTSSYRKPWPRPWPCGIVWLHWDSRMVRVVRQEVDMASGVATIRLEHDNLRGAVKPFTLTCFVSRENGIISVASDTADCPVVSVAYVPHRDAKAQLPEPELSSEDGRFSCYQPFPATAPAAGQAAPPRSGKDRNFALSGALAGAWKADAEAIEHHRVLLRSASPQRIQLAVALFTPGDLSLIHI